MCILYSHSISKRTSLRGCTNPLDSILSDSIFASFLALGFSRTIDNWLEEVAVVDVEKLTGAKALPVAARVDAMTAVVVNFMMYV